MFESLTWGHFNLSTPLFSLSPTNFKEKDVEVVVVVQPLESEEKLAVKTEYSAKKRQISEIIEKFRQLRREIPSDGSSIREMIEEGRRF